MKNKASFARKARLEAAMRLINRHVPMPQAITPKPQKEKIRHMVPPVEVSIKVATP